MCLNYNQPNGRSIKNNINDNKLKEKIASLPRNDPRGHRDRYVDKRQVPVCVWVKHLQHNLSFPGVSSQASEECVERRDIVQPIECVIDIDTEGKHEFRYGFYQ